MPLNVLFLVLITYGKNARSLVSILKYNAIQYNAPCEEGEKRRAIDWVRSLGPAVFFEPALRRYTTYYRLLLVTPRR